MNDKQNRKQLSKLATMGVQAAINAHALAQELLRDAERRAENILRAPRRKVAECKASLDAVAAEAVDGLVPDGAQAELERKGRQMTGWVVWDDPPELQAAPRGKVTPMPTPAGEASPLEDEHVAPAPPDPLAAFENEADPMRDDESEAA